MDPKKTTLAALIHAFIAADRPAPLGASALSRLAWWDGALGTRPVIDISPDEVDAALAALTARGRLRPIRGRKFEATGKSLAGSTINRHMTSLGGLYKFARRLRVVPRGHQSPLAGLERAPEPVDPERYLRPEEVERLIVLARVVDRRWRKLPALIRLAYTTGLRRGNLMALRWRDCDLEARTVSVAKTKNGSAIVAPIPSSAVDELRRLPRPSPEALVFGGPRGKPYETRRLWIKVTTEAGLAGRNFHQLRHGTASALAMSGCNQMQLMHAMGHKSIRSSARYVHLSVDDRRAVMEKVFGP